MATNKLMYTGANSDAGPSPSIWGNCPVAEMLEDPNVGYHFFDDFLAFGVKTLPTTVGHASGGYDGFGSAGNTVAAASTTAGGGGITITGHASTDNLSIALSTVAKPFRITSSASTAGKKLWFECSVAKSLVADTGENVFVGLCDTQVLAVAIPMTTAGALADMNCVGFHQKEADGNAWDFSYKADGVTAVDLETGAGVAVAATANKLGFVFDPANDNKLEWYVDGAKSTTTYTVPDNTGTDFPADVVMGLIVGQMNAAGTPGKATLNWWKCAQLR